MRYLSILLILFFLSVFSAYAQSNAAITKVVQNGQKIELTVISSKPFYVGDNIHILHIGKKEFSLYKQSKKEGKGILTFFIPAEEFNTLTEGEDVWMTYGNKFRKRSEQKNPAVFCKKNPKVCWFLGKFSSNLTGK